MATEKQIMARLYHLERLQVIPRQRDDVFAFFATAANLETLTPAFLRFNIVTAQSMVIRCGTLIDYKLHLLRIPLRWRTRIEVFEPPYRFADRQIKGPYYYWYHVHEFHRVAASTLMLDRVEYALPFGPLGRLMHRLVVRRMLDRIFDYRYDRLNTLFPPHNAVPVA